MSFLYIPAASSDSASQAAHTVPSADGCRTPLPLPLHIPSWSAHPPHKSKQQPPISAIISSISNCFHGEALPSSHSLNMKESILVENLRLSGQTPYIDNFYYACESNMNYTVNTCSFDMNKRTYAVICTSAAAVKTIKES